MSSLASYRTPDDEESYAILRNFTSPLVAITSRHGETTNGMIANSAIRASLVPEMPRVAFYCFKNHFSHELIRKSGRFVLHLLHRGQFEAVHALGFRSGRDRDKFSELPVEFTEGGLPVLVESPVYLVCRVVNAMDAGPSTFYLGDVVDSGVHPDREEQVPLTGAYFREQIPGEWEEQYRENKRRAQAWAAENRAVDPTSVWEPPEE